MKNFIDILRRKRILITAFIIVSLLSIGIKKVLDFALPPNKPKNCDFILPSAIDQTKTYTITLTQPPDPSLAFTQQYGTINDASCLNQTAIYGIIAISQVGDISSALQFARQNNLKVAPAGQHHTMGGQSFIKHGLVLNMQNFDHMELNKDQKLLTVQSGATWAKVQKFLDAQGLAPKAMQSFNLLSIGGTLSANAHGIAHNPGQVAPGERGQVPFSPFSSHCCSP